MAISNRITQMLGIDYPIVQAPMGWIARSQLASAVSNTGALGIIETSSGQLDAIREEIKKMKSLTDRPFGVNIAHAFVRDEEIVDFVIQQGVKFVTTSAGDPARYCQQLKAAGLTVFHVVPTLKAAMKAVEAGVDGLIVEGGEGGGFKNPQPVSTMVRCRLFGPIPTFRSSPQAASAVAEPWRRLLRWGPRGFRWALGWSLLKNHRSTPTGSRPSLMRPKLTLCS